MKLSGLATAELNDSGVPPGHAPCCSRERLVFYGNNGFGDSFGNGQAKSILVEVSGLGGPTEPGLVGQNVDLELALFEADLGDDPERALDLARRAHAARPDNVYAADALAWAPMRAGRVQEAVEPMEAALRLGTTDPLVRFHAAEVRAAVGDDARARDELAVALDTNRWFSVAHRKRAGQLAGQLGVNRPTEWQSQ